jgi:hypothetical protein
VKEKSLVVARILESWGRLVVTVTYNILAEMTKKQNTVAKSIYIAVRDVYFFRRSLSDQRDNFEWSCLNEAVRDFTVTRQAI